MAIGTRSYTRGYLSSSGLPPGIRALLVSNVAIFVIYFFSSRGLRAVFDLLALRPADVVTHYYLWQLVTYSFLHGGIGHILFNMLALWMFGVELERKWGTRYFLKFYFVTGIGAGVLTVVFAQLPFGFAQQLQHANVIGASGAIYGLLLAYALYFPDRPIYMYFVFPIPAKVFVAIMGAIAFVSSLGEAGGVANATHLGGLLIAYLFLKSARVHPLSEMKYRYLKWKINRVRKKFDVYSGGRANDWDRRVH